MKTFGTQRKCTGRRYRCLSALAGLFGSALLLSTAAPAFAVTEGLGQISGSSLLSIFGLPPRRNYDENNNPTGNPINLNGTSFSYIRNEYIGVVLGEGGTYTQNYDDLSVANRIQGRISFGNVFGNLRGTDEGVGLTTLDEALWPLAGDRQDENGFFSATGFTGINIVNPTTGAETTHILGATGTGTAPRIGFTQFRDNSLVTTYGTNNITVEQTIILRRSTARMQWVIRNNGTTTQRVGLLFVNNLPINSYTHPTLGRTDRPALFTNATVPARLEFPFSRVNPATQAEYIFRAADSVPPTEVAVAAMNSFFELRFRRPSQVVNEYPTLTASRVEPAVASYWDAVSLAGGQSRTIITYVGNGSDTEDVYPGYIEGSTTQNRTPAYVPGVEAIESLSYNAEGIANINAGERANATLATGTAFLSPTTFPIYGSVYNQSPSSPIKEVILNNVSVTLSLPTGLAFGSVAGGGQDTATKIIGNLPGDTDGIVQWSVRATGESYGTLPYSMTTSTTTVPTTSTVTRTIAVPATPIRPMSNADWTLISFPFQFDSSVTNNGDPNSVVNGITSPADLPGGNVPIYSYDPLKAMSGGNVYPIVTSIIPGKGYFYRPSLDRTVMVNGASPVPNQADAQQDFGQQFQMPLKRGWNMIGTPFLYDLPLGYIRVIALSPAVRSYPWKEAVNAGLLRGTIFAYVGGTDNEGYTRVQDEATPIHPWYGYWIYANTDLEIAFPAPHQINAIVTGTTPTTRATGAVPASIVPSADAVVIKPTTRGGSVVAQSDFSGRTKRPAIGGKVEVVATVGGESVSTVVGETGGSSGEGKTVSVSVVSDAHRVRPNGAGTTIEVRSRKAGPVTVTWPNVTATSGQRYKLTNVATGKSVALQPGGSFTFEADGKTAARFQLDADDSVSGVIRDLVALQAGESNAYTIAYELSAAAKVTVNVVTMDGTVVTSLQTATAAAAGKNTLLWSGRSRTGEALKAGAYLIEVTARTEDGKSAVQSVPVLVLD